jgi:putative ATPase
MSQYHAPLAARLRPSTLEAFVGQTHLLAPGKPLWQALKQGIPHSMIFWGPPGTGKTTLARLLAHRIELDFVCLSAVTAGVKDIRAAIETASRRYNSTQQKTVLFIDEVHRFNKAQQDVFLPDIEEGTIIFIGATTENPSFEINNALLSRCRVYVLKSLSESDILTIITQALSHPDLGIAINTIEFPEILKKMLAKAADGDARRALNFLELLLHHAPVDNDCLTIRESLLVEVLSGTLNRFDKGGDIFYDQISALHKSVRGSSPDAALYWFARMIAGGCDPLYIARRIIRMGTEDIGNADPRALEIALNAWDVQTRLGSPEGELALAQAIVYLAVAPKSNAVYLAYQSALAEVKSGGSLEVPLHLRNAPTALLRTLQHGANYRYAHDEAQGFSAGQSYFPTELGEREYYHPVERGLEIKIKEKLEKLKNITVSS